jgi:hypothetical protein
MYSEVVDNLSLCPTSIMPIFDGINSAALFTTWFMSHIIIISNITYQLLSNTLPVTVVMFSTDVSEVIRMKSL